MPRIVGTTAVIKNDHPIAQGVVELDDTRADEVWFRLKFWGVLCLPDFRRFSGTGTSTCVKNLELRPR